jgi:hypothetical protein
VKVSSVVMPEKAFQVLRDGNSCTVEFFDNVKSNPAIDGMTGQSVPSWDYEKYTLAETYRSGLAAEIESNYSTWLQKAKDAELAAEAEKVRNYRDNLLNTCDTVYCNAEKWAAMTADQQKVWTAYKQALRDVPAQEGFPYTVNWPVMPAGGAHD